MKAMKRALYIGLTALFAALVSAERLRACTLSSVVLEIVRVASVPSDESKRATVVDLAAFACRLANCTNWSNWAL